MSVAIDGYLKKKSKKTGVLKKTWNKRWFALAGENLSYSNTPRDKVPSAVYKISDLQKIAKLSDTQFEMEFPSRVLVLRGTDAVEVRRWLEALEAARQYLAGLPTDPRMSLREQAVIQQDQGAVYKKGRDTSFKVLEAGETQAAENDFRQYQPAPQAYAPPPPPPPPPPPEDSESGVGEAENEGALTPRRLLARPAQLEAMQAQSLEEEEDDVSEMSSVDDDAHFKPHNSTTRPIVHAPSPPPPPPPPQKDEEEEEEGPLVIPPRAQAPKHRPPSPPLEIPVVVASSKPASDPPKKTGPVAAAGGGGGGRAPPPSSSSYSPPSGVREDIVVLSDRHSEEKGGANTTVGNASKDERVPGSKERVPRVKAEEGGGGGGSKTSSAAEAAAAAAAALAQEQSPASPPRTKPGMQVDKDWLEEDWDSNSEASTPTPQGAKGNPPSQFANTSKNATPPPSKGKPIINNTPPSIPRGPGVQADSNWVEEDWDSD